MERLRKIAAFVAAHWFPLFGLALLGVLGWLILSGGSTDDILTIMKMIIVVLSGRLLWEIAKFIPEQKIERLAARFAAPGKMTAYQLFSWLWDRPFWAYVQIEFGFLGVIGAALGAIAINYGFLKWNSRKKISWLFLDRGAEEIRNNIRKILLRTSIIIGIVFYDGSLVSFCIVVMMSIFILVLNRFIFISRTREDIFMFFALSFWQDSFITTAYLRHGRCDGISKYDRKIFWLSSIVSVIYWTISAGLMIEYLIQPLF